MAIEGRVKASIATIIEDWVMHGIIAGAQNSVKEYHRYKVSDPALAEGHLQRAAHMPKRFRSKLDRFSAAVDAERGAGEFNTFIAEGLILAGSAHTIASLNTELTAREADTDAFRAMKTAGDTLDEIAAEITLRFGDTRNFLTDLIEEDGYFDTEAW